jgi:hypothetical protein
MSAETNDAVKSDSHFLMLMVGLAEGGHPVLLAPGAQKDAEGVCLNGSSFGGGGRTGKFWERRFKFSYLSKLKGEEEEARCRSRNAKGDTVCGALHRREQCVLTLLNTASAHSMLFQQKSCSSSWLKMGIGKCLSYGTQKLWVSVDFGQN